jgi:CBS domain-containing protein
MKLPTVREYMDTVVPTVAPDMEIMSAVNFLLDKHVTGAPVVNDEMEIVGFISEKDCLKLLALGSDDADRPGGLVGEYMTTPVKTIPSNMNIYFVAGMFLNDDIRRFPVVDGKKLVGAITRFDILRAIRANLS